MIYTFLIRLCLSAFLLVSLVAIQSCGTSAEAEKAPSSLRAMAKYIPNDWKVQTFKPGVDFSASPQHLEKFKEFEKNARFDFNSDATYYFDIMGDIQTGTWVLNKKTMTLTTTSSANVTTVAKVIELTSEKMVIEQQSDGYVNTITLVPKVAE